MDKILYLDFTMDIFGQNTSDSSLYVLDKNISNMLLIGDLNITPSVYSTDTVNATIKPYAIVTLILGITGNMLNIASIAAIFQVRHKWTCVFRLMFSLMLSDILIATSVMTLVFLRPFDGRKMDRDNLWEWCSFVTIKALFTMSMNITLLNLMAMALDHFIAILYPLKYSTLLSSKRSNIMILMLWVLAFLTGYSDFVSPLWRMDSYKLYSRKRSNFCHFIWLSRYNEEYTTFVIAFSCAFVMVPVYLKIYFKARKIHKIQRNIKFTLVSKFNSKNSILDKTKNNKKTLITTLLILGTFILCWLPLCFFQVIPILLLKFNPAALKTFLLSSQNILEDIDETLLCILLLNPICDPVIYAIRICEVRQGFLKLLSKLSPKKFQEIFDEPNSVLNYRRYSVTYFLNERRGTQMFRLTDDTIHKDAIHVNREIKVEPFNNNNTEKIT